MRGTRYVAATQDLSRRVEAIGDDELAGLARSFNAMLESLAESRRAQRQLIADASHELRTPLTTVQANVELLAARVRAPPEERQQLREDLISQLRELTSLVGDLVELAREQPPESDLEELELDALVTACVERARSRGRARTLHPRARRPGARRPPVRLERAVTNLLDNARKWSPDGADGRGRRSPTASSWSATRARASTRPTSRTCSTASTARPTRAGCPARASAWRSCARWRRCTAAPSGPRRRATSEEPNCISGSPHWRVQRHFSEVHDRSHIELNALTAPLTSAERSSACLSQIQATSGACLGDHHVDLAPGLGALLRIGQELRLVHRGVDLRVVELGPVGVALLDDVLAVERRVEHRLSVGEVLAPADVRADRDVGRRRVAEARVHRVLRDEPQPDLEAHLLELLLGDLGRLLGDALGRADHQQRLAAGVLARRVAGLLEVLGGQRRVTLRVRHEVQTRALQATGLLEAGQPRRDHVRRDVADELAAAHEAHARCGRSPRPRPCGC